MSSSFAKEVVSSFRISSRTPLPTAELVQKCEKNCGTVAGMTLQAEPQGQYLPSLLDGEGRDRIINSFQQCSDRY